MRVGLQELRVMPVDHGEEKKYCSCAKNSSMPLITIEP